MWLCNSVGSTLLCHLSETMQFGHVEIKVEDL